MDPQQITIEKVKNIVGDLYLQVAMLSEQLGTLSEQLTTLTQKLAARESPPQPDQEAT